MEVVRRWAFSLCAALIVTAIMRLLTPKGGMKWIYNLLLNVFLLGVLISPFAASMPKISPMVWEPQSAHDIEERAKLLTETIDIQAENAIQLEAEKILLSELAKMGIKSHASTIHIIVKRQNETEEQPPMLAEVYLAGEYRQNPTIKQALETALGFPVKFVPEGGSE